MSDFLITAPDGQKYKIKAPPGATQDQALAYAKQKLGGSQKPPIADPAKIIADRKDTAGKIGDGLASVPSRIADMAAETHLTTAPPDKRVFMPDIDRKGLPFEQASSLMAADNKAEREKALKAIDPKASLHTDFGGRDYVKFPDGREVYVEPHGEGVGGKLAATGKTMAEQAYARPGETTGAVVAGALSDGIVPAMGAAGGAGSIGYLIDQAVKASRDRYAKTPGQLALGAAEAGAMNAVGEGVGRLPGTIARGGLPKVITGNTPEKEEFTRTLVKRGAAPSYAAGAPGLASAEWKVNLAKKLGLPVDDARVRATAAEIESFLAKHGVDDAKGTLNPTKVGGSVRVGGEEKYGEKLVTPLQQTKAKLDKAIEIREQQNKLLDQGIAEARTAAEASVKKLQSGQGPTSTNFKQTVADDLMAAKEAKDKYFAMQYQKLAGMEQGLSASTAPISRTAKDIMAALPKDATGKVIGIDEKSAPRIAMLEQLSNLPPEMPIADVANIRSQLGKLGSLKTLLPPTKNFLTSELKTSADRALELATTTRPDAQAFRKIVEGQYRTEMRKLDDNLAARLVKDAGKTGSVDADDVIPMMSRSPGQFKRVWNLLQPDSKRRVGRGLFDDMVGRATKDGQISGQAFVDQLNKHAGVLRDVYGKDAPKIIQAARALQAVDGKLPLDKRLMPENVVQALETAAATQRKMDDFYKNNALAALIPGTDPGNAALASARKEVAAAQLARSQAKAKPPTSAEMRDRIQKAGAQVGGTEERRMAVAGERVADAKKAIKDFDQGQFAKLADPNFLKDNAVDYIIRPGQQDLLKKAIQLYGPGSEQVKSLQEAFLRKAVASGTREITDPKRAFGGEGIRDFLKQYTPEQKRILLEPYGGEEGLQKISRFYDFVFPASSADVSAGLAGGELKSHVGPGALLSAKGLGSIYKYGKAYLTGAILSHPQFYKWLVLGIDGDPAALRALDAGLRTYVQTSASQQKAMGSPPAAPPPQP